MSDGNQATGSLFFYEPSTAAAAVFTAAYGILTILHFWQSYRTKSWITTGLLCFSALSFTSGFAVRIYCSYNYTHVNAFIATQFIVYATAPLLELANAHILGRIMYYVPYLSPIHPGRVLSTFLMLSCLVEVLNALGVMQSIAGNLVSRNRTPEETASLVREGQALMKAALILQISFALLIVALAASVQIRCRRRGIRNHKIHLPILGVYLSMGLVTARTVYRTVEHFAFADLSFGQAGRDPASIAPVVRFEWYFYVFEATFMLLAVAAFNALHPRRWLPARKSTYLAQDGETELERPGWSDKRPFIVTLCDPFNLIGCLSRTPRSEGGGKFWENNGFQFKTVPGAGKYSREEQGLKPTAPAL